MAARKRRRGLNLQDALSQNTFHNAIFTTYTFDPMFFEDYCIENFPSLANNGNLSVLVDRGIYETIIAAPPAERPRLANLRYLVHPIAVPGRFHPKLFLLTTKTTGRLILGSANLTRPGLTSNAEIVDQYDFEEREDEHLHYLFCEAFEFLRTLVQRWPSENLRSNVDELYRATPWLQAPPKDGARPIRFLHNLDRPLWEQLQEILPGKADRMHVISRFFDSEPDLIDLVVGDLKPSKLFIYTENGRTTLTRAWLKHKLVKSGKAEVLFCHYEDEGYQQALHAKAIVIESSRTCCIVYGSANFTSPALLCNAHNGNVEVLIAVPSLKTNTVDLKQFLDPCGNAYRLASDDHLDTATREPKSSNAQVKPFQLAEAILDGNKIFLHGSFAGEFSSSVSTNIEWDEPGGRNLETLRQSQNRCTATVPKQLLAILSQRSSCITLKDSITGQYLSNKILLTNLLDIESHEAVRQERRFREANQSASQFFAVLNDLLRAGDNSALLNFLNFCDIPLLNVPSRHVIRQRPVWSDDGGMRTLGERNLQICKDLHEATLNFFERHLRKLRRHTETRILEGIPNFLHIFLSMGNLLRTQIERTIIALETKPTVTVDDWADCRNLWDVYYCRFHDLMHCLWDDYLRRISHEQLRKDIELEFGPDLEAIHELCCEMLQFRERVSQIRKAKNFNYGYFYSVMGAERWKRFSSEVVKQQHEVSLAVLGTNAHSSAHTAT